MEPTLNSAPEAGKFAYVPHVTLGRSGLVPGPNDRLGDRIEQLDALLCLVTNSEALDDGFRSCNEDIQFAVLRLASSLATEIHEIHEELLLTDLAQSAHLRRRPVGGKAQPPQA